LCIVNQTIKFPGELREMINQMCRPMRIFLTVRCAIAIFVMLLSMSFLFLPDSDLRQEKAFEVYSEDSILMEVELVYNAQDMPDYYFSHIKTPVCEDSLCHLVEIDLYWDLLGNFQKYEVPPHWPLTKFDHEEFSEEDYEKLQKILLDKHSLLEDQKVEDLIDENTKLVSAEVDAVTGATKKSVEKAVVSGAVYTVYTLWHIVNGEISKKITPHTESLWNEALLQNFLQSGHYPYLYYALDHIPVSQYADYMPDILPMLDEENVFVARYAIEKIPFAIFEDENWQISLVNRYPHLNYKSQDKLLQRLKSVPVTGESMNLLSQQLDQLSEHQLDEMLALFIQNKTALSENTVDQIVALVYHDNAMYAEKGYETLQKLQLKSKKTEKAINNYENK
jgi:hypothetical protein